MDEILRQLGELLLAAIPTVVVFLILFFSYKLIVHNRLAAVLDERRARTARRDRRRPRRISPPRRRAPPNTSSACARRGWPSSRSRRRAASNCCRLAPRRWPKPAPQPRRRVKAERAAFAQDVEKAKLTPAEPKAKALPPRLSTPFSSRRWQPSLRSEAAGSHDVAACSTIFAGTAPDHTSQGAARSQQQPVPQKHKPEQQKTAAVRRRARKRERAGSGAGRSFPRGCWRRFDGRVQTLGHGALAGAPHQA